MHWWIMLPVCIFGVVLCDAFLYWIGRRWGARLLSAGWVQRRLLPLDKRQKIEGNFHKYGVGILLAARVTPGIRTPIFLMSGMLRLPFRKFLLADGLYAIPGVNLLFWLAYWFTDRFLRAYELFEGNKYLVITVVLAAVSGFLAYSFLIRRRVATGSPEDIPVVGGTVASTLTHITKPVPAEQIEAVELRISRGKQPHSADPPKAGTQSELGATDSAVAQSAASKAAPAHATSGDGAALKPAPSANGPVDYGATQTNDPKSAGPVESNGREPHTGMQKNPPGSSSESLN
jgi:membrane protein DedA with SNARE-associated domain